MNVIHTKDGCLDEFSVCCNGVSVTVQVDSGLKGVNVLYAPVSDLVGHFTLNSLKDAESLRDALTKAIEHVKAGQ